MKRKKRIKLFFILFIIVNFAFSGEKPQLKILSKNIIQKGDKIYVNGEIKIIYGKLTVTGKKLIYNKKTEKGIIEKSVEVVSGNILLRAKKIEFDFKKQIMKGYEGFGYIGDELIIEAKEFFIKEGKFFDFKKGEATCCIQANPRWSIGFSKAYAEKDDHLSVWGAILKVKKIPSFYFPYFYYPIQKKRRKTGFLFPYLGYSTFKGYSIKESFFLPLKDNFDLTVSGVYYSELGRGIEGNIRYGDWYGNSLNIESVFLKNSNEDKTNYIIKGSGKINFTPTFYLSINSNLVSTTDFVRDYTEDFNIALSRNFYSSAYLKKSFGNFQISLRGDHTETYYSFTNFTYKVRHLPKIEFSMLNTSIVKDFVYLSFSSGYSKTERYLNDEWLSVPRFYFKPSLSVPIPITTWFTFEFYLKGNYSYYLKSYDPETRKISDIKLFNDYSNLSIKITGPIIYRIFDTPWLPFFYKVKHLIEPSISYRYTLFSEENIKNVIQIEFSDFYFYHNSLTFSITNRFIGKKDENSASQEFFSFTLSQSYYLNPEKERITFLKPPDVEEINFSELSLSSRLNISKTIYFTSSSSYNHYYDKFTNLSFGLNMSLFKNSLTLSNSYSKRSYINIFGNTIDYSFIKANLTVKNENFPINLNSFINYDIGNKTLYSLGINIFFKFQCIGLKLDIMKIGYRVENDFMIRFSILPGNITPSVNLF